MYLNQIFAELEYKDPLYFWTDCVKISHSEEGRRKWEKGGRGQMRGGGKQGGGGKHGGSGKERPFWPYFAMATAAAAAAALRILLPAMQFLCRENTHWLHKKCMMQCKK